MIRVVGICNSYILGYARDVIVIVPSPCVANATFKSTTPHFNAGATAFNKAVGIFSGYPFPWGPHFTTAPEIGQMKNNRERSHAKPNNLFFCRVKNPVILPLMVAVVGLVGSSTMVSPPVPEIEIVTTKICQMWQGVKYGSLSNMLRVGD